MSDLTPWDLLYINYFSPFGKSVNKVKYIVWNSRIIILFRLPSFRLFL